MASTTRPEWAIFSPLPPSPSGIADYVAEHLEPLSRFFRLHVVVEKPEQAGHNACGDVVVHALEAFNRDPRLKRIPRLYHVGNNPFHEFVFREAIETPGVVVLHDFVIHHLISNITLGRGDAEAYASILSREHGKVGRHLARLRAAGCFSEFQQFLTPLSGMVIRRARSVIVHSTWAKRKIVELFPDTPTRCIPHHFFDGDLADLPLDRGAARAVIGADPDKLLFVCVGYVTPPKQVELLIRALGRVRSVLPEFELWLVGEAADQDGVVDLAKTEGLADRLKLTGRVALDMFQSAMLAADIVVNLRYPSAGETSGTLVRALGLGCCCVIFDYGTFADIPDDAAVRLPLDTADVDALADALVRLASDPGLRGRLGDAAKRHVLKANDLKRCASLYADAISESSSTSVRGRATARVDG